MSSIITTNPDETGMSNAIKEIREINVIKEINVIRGTEMTGAGTKRGILKPKWRKKRIMMEPPGSTLRMTRTVRREEAMATEEVAGRVAVDAMGGMNAVELVERTKLREVMGKWRSSRRMET